MIPHKKVNKFLGVIDVQFLYIYKFRVIYIHVFKFCRVEFCNPQILASLSG